MPKKISAIWAQDENGLIGKNQTMPWHLPADLKHFKAVTSGHAILMGRVTFDGLGQRALPNRTSLVLTRDKNYQPDNDQILIFHTISDILAWYAQQDVNLYIIGGAQIYKAFEHMISEVIRTDIHATFEGDTYFPKDFDLTDFELIKSSFHEKDAQNAFDFTVNVLERK